VLPALRTVAASFPKRNALTLRECIAIIRPHSPPVGSGPIVSGPFLCCHPRLSSIVVSSGKCFWTANVNPRAFREHTR
jgi:hypothetical protein